MITFRALDLPHDLELLKNKAQCSWCEDTKGIVAERDGEVVAVYVFDNWSHNSVQCHQWVGDPLVFKAGLHKVAAQYIFGDCDRGIMVGLVPANNDKARRLNEHYGFREAYRLPDGYEVGIDYIVYVMRAEDCPYWKPAEEDAA